MLGALYVAEGLPVGFFTQALPVMLRKQGYSLGDIGLISLLGVPWGLGFLWAPLVDRYGAGRPNHRRRWIISVQLLAACLFFFIGIFPGQGPRRLLIGVLLLNILITTQEIATDALAVDRMRSDERGLGSGIQIGGFRVGMIVGGGLLLVLYEHLGWRGTFVSIGSMLLLMLLPVLFMSEPARPIHEESNTSLLFPRDHFVRQPGAWRKLLLYVVYQAGGALATGMVLPLLSDLGLSMSDIGWLLGTAGAACGLLGGIIAGALIQPLGRHRALVLFGLLRSVTILGYALIASGKRTHPVLYALASIDCFTDGMGLVVLYTMAMDWCRPQSNATDISIQVSVMMIAPMVVSSVCGYSAQALGYRGHFLLSALISLAGVAGALVLLRSAQTESQPGEVASGPVVANTDAPSH